MGFDWREAHADPRNRERRKPQSILIEIVGAEAGTRTPMALRPLAPEASASANSATSAGWNLEGPAKTGRCERLRGPAEAGHYETLENQRQEHRSITCAC